MAALAGLDLDSLLKAIEDGDGGRREMLIEKANSRLKQAFEESWNQSSVFIRVSIQGYSFEARVSLPDESTYTEISDRSDGLLWFAVLCVFLSNVAQESGVKPILLVDEAETHLHYDAQADLIGVFTSQRLAAKIIYSTHSAGCLPRDLGNGIRIVVPEKDTERSVVKNNVWESSEPGFSPLVYGMGATTFAFLPARHVLFGEGLSDAMLYPTLFRRTTGLSSLEFQIVPGIAFAGPARMSGMQTDGGAVAYIVDGDSAGSELRTNL